jgi:hypothetical protein
MQRQISRPGQTIGSFGNPGHSGIGFPAAFSAMFLLFIIASPQVRRFSRLLHFDAFFESGPALPGSRF